MLTPTQPIHQAGAFAVLAPRHEVMWPDGTALALHPVQYNGHGSLTHRAVELPNGSFIIVDLELMLAPLGPRLRQCSEREAPGAVFQLLRQGFRSAAHFQARAQAEAVAS